MRARTWSVGRLLFVLPAIVLSCSVNAGENLDALKAAVPATDRNTLSDQCAILAAARDAGKEALLRSASLGGEEYELCELPQSFLRIRGAC